MYTVIGSGRALARSGQCSARQHWGQYWYPSVCGRFSEADGEQAHLDRWSSEVTHDFHNLGNFCRFCRCDGNFLWRGCLAATLKSIPFATPTKISTEVASIDHLWSWSLFIELILISVYWDYFHLSCLSATPVSNSSIRATTSSTGCVMRRKNSRDFNHTSCKYASRPSGTGRESKDENSGALVIN